ncbi:MAG: DUF262 domain-containing protein [Chloroflexi bacterium]|nr:DUF262 domain-containing protein [Chloroflexota bacterium]
MFETIPVSLKSLLEDSGNGKIQLPDFQRGWVWEDDRIRGLLPSISRGFPVGAVMTLQAGGEIRLKSRMIEGVGGESGNVAESFLLDGQQRLTSLYQSLLHKGPVDTHDNRGRRIRRWYYVDILAPMDPNVDREDAIISVPENRIETRNFGREIIRDLSSREKEFHQHMLPTEQLLDGMGWILGYNSYWMGKEHPVGDLGAFLPECQRLVIDPFVNYDLPVIRLSKETPKEAVCTVFEKVNTGGVTLSMFELVTASFAAQDDDFSLRDEWAARRDRMHRAHGVLKGIGGNQFLQAIALLSTQERRRVVVAAGQPQNRVPAINCRKNDILGLDVSDYHRWADRVESGFMEAAKFLFSQFIFMGYNVPYATQLVPLATLFVELGKALEPANAKAKLERWFWAGIFGEAYGGAVETQYALDLTQVAEWIRGGPEPALVGEANFVPERLLSLRTRNSAAYKGLYALQMKSGAADWRKDEPLTLADYLQENIDIHHIFPVAWCSGKCEPKVPPRLYNSIINKTPIDARTNRIIGGRAPSEYLPRLENEIVVEKLDKVLESHWILPALLREDDFAKCFVERGEAMLELIGQAMGKSIPSGEEVFWNALTAAGFVKESDGGEIPEDADAALTATTIIDDFDDPEDEYDDVGELAYNSVETAAAD